MFIVALNSFYNVETNRQPNSQNKQNIVARTAGGILVILSMSKHPKQGEHQHKPDNNAKLEKEYRQEIKQHLPKAFL